MEEAISVGIGIVDAKTIDEINILEASRLAMKLAIDNLSVKPQSNYHTINFTPANETYIGLSVSSSTGTLKFVALVRRCGRRD